MIRTLFSVQLGMTVREARRHLPLEYVVNGGT